MREKAKAIFATATLRQSGITFGGTIINGGLGAVFYILTARALGPAQFGLMNIALNVLLLATAVGDFGVDTGLVRFVSYYRHKDKARAKRFLKLSLETKIVVGFFITFLGFFVSPLIASYLFQKPELTNGLRIAFLGVAFFLLFGFVTATLKAFQKFFLWSLVQVGANLIRVLIILTLFLLGLITIETSLWTYALMVLLGFIFGFLFLIPKDFLAVRKSFVVAREFFHYNKWIASFTLVAAFSSRLDTFIGARLLTPTEIGLYAAANQLVYIVPQIIGALGTVFAPKMSEMGSQERLVLYLKKAQALVLGLSFLGILAAPVVSLFVPVIYGSEYAASVPIFFILLLAMLVFLISVPIHNAILYYYSYPRLFFWLSLGHLTIIGISGWVLISAYGATGGAISVLLGSIFNFLVPALWVLRKIRK